MKAAANDLLKMGTLGLLPACLLLPSWSSAALGALIIFIVFLELTWPLPLGKDTPRPSGLPYFEQVFFLLKHSLRLPDACVEKMHEYGGRTWAIRLPRIGLVGGACVVVTNPKTLKHVLKDNFGNYVKGDALQTCMAELFGNGIFATDGLNWTLHRKVAHTMFSLRLLKESTHVAARMTQRMITHLKTVEGPVDMQMHYFRLTMDIFGYIAFGIDLNSVALEREHEFTAAFDEVQRCCEKRMYNPLWLLCKWLQLTAEERAITRGTKVVNSFAAEVIASRRRTAADGGQLGPDLLSRFLDDAQKKEMAEEEAAAVAESGEGPAKVEARLGGSDTELRDVVLNFIIAGRDTTACALSWTLYELARAPEVRAKMRAEFRAAFAEELAADAAAGGSGCGALEAAWTYENVAKLRYAHAVSLEVLRLHPSVAKDIKWAVADDRLPDGTFVPAGAALIYCPYQMNRDAARWEEPLRFRPERFLGDGGVSAEPGTFEYPVFNAGPRLCPGKPLALMETKLVTAMLLHNFDFELAVPHEGGYLSTVVLPMSPGIKVQLYR